MTWDFKVAPDPLTKAPRKPWDHQIESFGTWRDHDCYGCLWDMGTGKTAMAANLLEYKRLNGLPKGLILSSGPVSYGWVEEFEGAWGVKVANLTLLKSSAQRNKALQAMHPDVPYVIINYDGLEGVEEALFRWLGDAYSIVADESTAMKNPRAIRSKVAVRLSGNAGFRMIMSGTPMPQGPHDIFGQYLFLDPRVFGGSFVTFRNHWMRMGGFGGKEILGLKKELQRAFNTTVYSIADRRTKADCLSIPPKNYQTMFYDLAPAAKKVYDELAREWVAEISSDKRISVTDGMTKSLRLAQVCTGFVGDRLAGETEEHEIGEVNAKMDVLEALLETLDGKFIIWCAWRRNVRDVMALLKRMNIKAVDFYGETDDKQASQFAFRNDASTRGFVGTQASGGPGLNLQGPTVKTTVYFSQDYSVFKRLQSEDRAHRGEMTHTLTVVDICAKRTIEEAIVKALRQGRNVQDFLLQHPSAFVEGNIPEETQDATETSVPATQGGTDSRDGQRSASPGPEAPVRAVPQVETGQGRVDAQPHKRKRGAATPVRPARRKIPAKRARVS